MKNAAPLLNGSERPFTKSKSTAAAIFGSSGIIMNSITARMTTDSSNAITPLQNGPDNAFHFSQKN